MYTCAYVTINNSMAGVYFSRDAIGQVHGRTHDLLNYDTKDISKARQQTLQCHYLRPGSRSFLFLSIVCKENKSKNKYA